MKRLAISVKILVITMRLEIETSGDKLSTPVTVEGSDSDRDWKMLNNDGVIFSFSFEQ